MHIYMHKHVCGCMRKYVLYKSQSQKEEELKDTEKKKKNPLHSDYETLDANKKHSLG